MSGKVYLITGANRGAYKQFSLLQQHHLTRTTIGIGRGMFNNYVAQSYNTIIAAVRNPEAAQNLLDVPKGENTKVIITKIDLASKTDPYEAVNKIQSKGINHIDVVILSAGIAKLNTIEDMPLLEYEEVLQINAISVMLWYKAALPLLRNASRPAKFAFISAAGGSCE